MKHLISIMIVAIFSQPAMALLGEFRVSYDSVAGEPDEYNTAYFDQQDGPEISGQTYLGADAIIMLPAIPFGFGLRYETTAEELTEFTETIDYKLTRMSLLLNWRIIDTGFYLGPILSYGISHDFEFAIPTDPEVISSDGASSLGFGVEAGLKMGLFRLGVEVGQLNFVFDELTEIDTGLWTKNSLPISELDFGGVYYKIHLGVGF